MKTKWNLLVMLAMLMALVGMSASPAQAATITWSPFPLPDGQKGVAYTPTQITVSGEGCPCTITLFVEGTHLPDGMSFDDATDTLSGTPTETGGFELDLDAWDATGAFASGMEYGLSINVDGTFSLSSSPNPSDLEAEVTFTLSATGDAVDSFYGPIAPTGQVTFYDDGTAIEGCYQIYLNIDPINQIIGDLPAVCKTAMLPPGNHVITAEYIDGVGLYNDATITLSGGQVVAIPADAMWLENASFSSKFSRGTCTYTGSFTIGSLSGPVSRASVTVVWVDFANETDPILATQTASTSRTGVVKFTYKSKLTTLGMCIKDNASIVKSGMTYNGLLDKVYYCVPN